ncbi:unnamed protein product [Trifolium pratense]|uniref:Uncharacterized protein n=1 Tax=Trifolium pratense TaxID=57577 RepID=A0ACB0KN46_TRIPR|nr:unnamed protein product [Trifolium pratense]
MYLTYQFSTIFFSSYSFINPKLPNLNHKSHKFKTFFSYKSPNSLHHANLNDPDAKISSLSKTLKSKIEAENIFHNISDPETAILALKNLPDNIQPENRLFLYNTVFKLFGENKVFEKAEKLFDEMLQRGIKPNTLTFSNLIRSAALCSLPHKAVEFFEKMPSFGCEPDYNVISSMIYAYAYAGNVDMALKLYDSAKNEKLPIWTTAFSVLIKMYRVLRNYDGCLSVYDDMKVLGIKPNEIVYNTLLAAMGKAKRARDAKGIYQDMRKDGFEPNWITYSALLEAYARGRYINDALIVYKEMKEKRMTLNKFLYSMLLDMCADVGYIDDAVEIFEEMKHSGTCQPDSFIYSSLINMYACNGNILQAEAMLNEMISCGVEPNIFVLTSFVHCYGKAKQTDDVVKIFNQFWDMGITPDDRLCGCLLYVMTQIPKDELGKITNCIEKANPKLGYIVKCLTEEKEDDGYFMKEVSELLSAAAEYVKKSLCNSLIDICYNLGMEDRARDLLGLGLWLEIYNNIQSRSETQWCLNLKPFSVGAAITALHVWLDDLSKAFESGEELPQVLGICWRYNPSDKDLAIVFESYLKELNSPFYKDADRTGWFYTTSREAKSWLHSRGLNETVADLNPTVLDVPINLSSFHNPIPQPLVTLQHVQLEYPDAKSSPIENQVYEILKGFGDNITEHDAGFILNNMSNLDNAMLVFKYFVQKVQPVKQVILYNVMLKLFRESREFEKAEKLFYEMLQSKVKPDIITFSTMISCAGWCAKHHKAVEWFEMMPSFKCEPDDKLLSFMISSSASIGNVAMASRLYRRAIEKKWKIDKVAFSALIKMYGKSGDYARCLRVYSDMKVFGVKPNIATYNNLFLLMGTGKRAHKAKAIYEEMINNGISPNQSTYETVLQTYCRAMYKVDAMIVYKEMKEKGMDIGRVLYNMLLHMCLDVGYADEAVEIFTDMMKSGTCRPDSVAYTSLIIMYSRTGKVSEAEAILNEMMNCGFEPNVLVLTSLADCYGKAKQTDDVVRIFGQLLDFGLRPDDRFIGCLVHVMLQIPKQEHGKIIGCIEKAKPKLGFVVRYLMEERDGDGIFLKEASELFHSIDDYALKKSLCNSLIALCVNLEVLDRARDLFNLGLTLEFYTNVQRRSPTTWSLRLKRLSIGTSLIALQVWIDDLSKALESGEELPPVLEISTGKNMSKLSVVESYLKEYNASFQAFQKNNNETGFFATNELAKSWLQSRVLDVPAIVIESRPNDPDLV